VLARYNVFNKKDEEGILRIILQIGYPCTGF
jgi:hypothetical protein